MTYPILEYDPTREAFIEPSKMIKQHDMPGYCVVCFFSDVIDKVVAEHNARMEESQPLKRIQMDRHLPHSMRQAHFAEDGSRNVPTLT